MGLRDRASQDSGRRRADLAEQLVGAWAAGAHPDPDCRTVAFVSDRSGAPAALGAGSAAPTATAPEPPPAGLSDDPVIAVSWSADGAWLGLPRSPPDGGVRTQVWVVRPDGRDARRLAGGRGPARRARAVDPQRARLVVTIPGAEPGRAEPRYLVDPATGELHCSPPAS